jgi:hypothetical protein
MTFVAENGPRCVGELLRVGGPVRVLEVLFHYSRSQILEHKSLVYAALLLLNRDATVTICHSKTKNLAEFTRQALHGAWQGFDPGKTATHTARARRSAGVMVAGAGPSTFHGSPA